MKISREVDLLAPPRSPIWVVLRNRCGLRLKIELFNHSRNRINKVLTTGRTISTKDKYFSFLQRLCKKAVLELLLEEFPRGNSFTLLKSRALLLSETFFRSFINKKTKLTVGELISFWSCRSFPLKALRHLFVSFSFQRHSGIHQPQDPCLIRFFTYFGLWIFHFSFSTGFFGSLWSLLSNQVFFGLPFCRTPGSQPTCIYLDLGFFRLPFCFILVFLLMIKFSIR